MLQTLLKSKFFKDNAVFFVGAILTGALNYALYPAISRFLTVEEFGEFQVLFSLVLQLSIVFNVVRIFVINVVSNDDDDESNNKFIHDIDRVLLVGGIILCAVLLLLMPLLRSFLQFNSTAPFVPVIFVLLINFPLTTRIGYIHAKQEFARTSLIQGTQALLKLAFTTSAALLGFGVATIMWGATAANIVLLLFTVYQARKVGLSKGGDGRLSLRLTADQLVQFKKNGKYLLLVATIAAVTAFMLSIDSVIIKHYFSPEDAGRYAGIAVVARTVFFVTASVSGVLLASVKVASSVQTNIRTFLLSAGLVTILGSAVVGVIALFPHLIVTKLIGENFGSYSSLLTKLSISVLFISLINLIVYYHLALRDYWMGPVAVLGSSIVLLFVLSNHATLEAVVSAFLLGSSSFLAIAAGWSLAWHVRKIRVANEQTTT